MNHSFLQDPEGPDYAEVAERLRSGAGEGPGRPRQSRRRAGAVVAAGTIAVLIGGLIVVSRGGSSKADAADEGFAVSGSPVSVLPIDPTPQTAVPAPVDQSTIPSSTAAVEPVVATEPTDASTTTAQADPTTTVVNPTTSPEIAPPSSDQVVDDAATELPVRYAVYAGGQLFLRGSVPSQTVADEITGKAASVIGAENVIVEYVIDPAAPLPDNAPIYVADTVLFGAGSIDIKPEFYGLLDLGVALLAQYPNVTISIAGHTDSRGEDLYNYDLSKRRVDQIMQYLASKGADLNRVEALPKGEAEPIADNSTDAGRQANRRIEFTIFNLIA